MKAKRTSIRLSVISLMICYALLLAGRARGQSLDWALHPPLLFPTNEWGTVTNDCQLGLRMPKLQYKTGEEIVAAVILRNIGDMNYRYASRDEYADYEVTVKRTDGRIVPYTDSWARDKDSRSPTVFRAVTEALGPHQESLANSGWVHVTKRYKMDLIGEYVIVVKQHVVLAAPEPTRRFDVLSNPVTVTIVAPSVTKPEK